MSLQNPADRIYTALYNWIILRLTARAALIQVIERRSNAPSPKGHYLVIDQDVQVAQQGMASRGYRDETDYQSIVSDWAGTVAFWEVGASSATLATLLLDLDLQSSREYFSSLGISVGIPGPIVPMPDLDDSEYREQFRVELPIAFAMGQTDEALTYIETVELINNIQT